MAVFGFKQLQEESTLLPSGYDGCCFAFHFVNADICDGVIVDNFRL
jgi:hypothetical protein